MSCGLWLRCPQIRSSRSCPALFWLSSRLATPMRETRRWSAFIASPATGWSSMKKPRFELSTSCGTIYADGACRRSRQHRGAPAPSLSYSQTSVATRCTATTSCPSPLVATRMVLRSGFAIDTTRGSRCSLVACSTGSAARTSRERTAIPARRSSASAASTDCSRKLARYLVSSFGMTPAPAATSLTAATRFDPLERRRESLAALPPSAAGKPRFWREPRRVR